MFSLDNGHYISVISFTSFPDEFLNPIAPIVPITVENTVVKAATRSVVPKIPHSSVSLISLTYQSVVNPCHVTFDLDVLKEYTITYKKINRLRSVFCDLSRASTELDEEQLALIKKIAGKSDCISNGGLKEEYAGIFDVMGVLYDVEEDCFYDLVNPVKLHQVNLLPEKYFRPEPVEEVTLDYFSREVDRIKKEFKKLFKDVMEW